MSAEALLFCFGLPGEDTFPTSIVRNIFGPFIEKKDGNLWYLAFPDGGRCEVFVDEGEQTGSLMFDHAGGDDLFKAIFEIMRQTQTVLSWSFGGAAAVNASVIPHIPPEMIKGVGAPILVHSFKELKDVIENS